MLAIYKHLLFTSKVLAIIDICCKHVENANYLFGHTKTCFLNGKSIETKLLFRELLKQLHATYNRIPVVLFKKLLSLILTLFCSFFSSFPHWKVFIGWLAILLLDSMADFRFEFLYPAFMFLRNFYDSYRYQGLVYMYKYWSTAPELRISYQANFYSVFI